MENVLQQTETVKMSNNDQATVLMRKEQLKQVVQRYFDDLSSQNFSAIPYDQNVMLRAPLVPGGVNNPLYGKALVKEGWWTPLEPALAGVKIKLSRSLYK